MTTEIPPTIRVTVRDRQGEDETKRLLEQRWGCAIHHTGYLDAWDFVGVKDGRTVFLAELKTRTTPMGTYPTVFLSAYKWLRLAHASAALGVTALFVVRFTDAVAWIALSDVDARAHRVAGRTDREGMPNDRELMIEVPIASMKVVA